MSVVFQGNGGHMSFHPTLFIHPKMSTLSTKLTDLKLSSCTITFSELRRLISRTFQNLEYLWLEGCDFPDVKESNPPSPISASPTYASPLCVIHITNTSTLFNLVQLPFYFWLAPSSTEVYDGGSPAIPLHDLTFLSEISASLTSPRSRHIDLSSEYRWMYDQRWELYITLAYNLGSGVMRFPSLICFFTPRSPKVSNSPHILSIEGTTENVDLQLKGISFCLLPPSLDIPFNTYGWGHLDDLFSKLGRSGSLRHIRISVYSGTDIPQDVMYGQKFFPAKSYDIYNRNSKRIASLLPWTTTHCQLEVVIDGLSVPWDDALFETQLSSSSFNVI
ncbi:hypothetical protein ABKN59_011587 [Abortiporus biennis]